MNDATMINDTTNDDDDARDAMRDDDARRIRRNARATMIVATRANVYANTRIGHA